MADDASDGTSMTMVHISVEINKLTRKEILSHTEINGKGNAKNNTKK